MASPDKGPRLWPAIAVGVLVAGLLAFTWLGALDSSEQIRQSKVTQSASILLLGAFLMLLWAALFSRLPVRTRLQMAAVFVLGIAGFFLLFRYRGVSGDLVPQFETRFRTAVTDLPDVDWDALPGARDYPQFLGPNRDGRLSGVGLARDWAADLPEAVWRRPVGRGWSGFAVAGNTAVTQEQHGEEERVVAYELSTGKVKWASRELAHYTNALAGEGPRATPTIHEGRVFAMGGTGLLTALDLASGELLWKRDVLRDNDAELPVWGKSDSPLVLGERVIVSADGLVAYDAATGERVWQGGGFRSAYSSPILLELAGAPQIVSFNHGSVTGHEPGTGEVLWRHEWPSTQPNVAQPLPVGRDRLLVSVGYGVGAKLFQIRHGETGSFRAELLWESVRLKAKFANLVLHDGFVYGLDDGILVCLDPETGRRRWKKGRYGHGQVLLVDDLLLVQGEHGEVFLIEPSPDAWRELTRFRAMDAKIWNVPALAGHYLLMRNDAEAVLFELPLARESARR